jgi:hypothetical protein
MHLGFFVCIERLSGWVLLHVTITCKRFYQAHYFSLEKGVFSRLKSCDSCQFKGASDNYNKKENGRVLCVL